jgi:endonuclease III
MDLFPKKYWNSINYILVRFGQSFGRHREEEDLILELW